MKMKFSEREQWLLFAAALMAVCYLAYQMFFLPKGMEVFTLSQKLTIESGKLKNFEEKAKVLKTIETAPLEKLRTNKSKERQTIEALRYIAQAVSNLDVDLVSIRPQNESSAGSAKTILFNIELYGSYNNIYKFMKTLSDLPILILIDSMNMVRGENSKVNVSLTLSVYY